MKRSFLLATCLVLLAASRAAAQSGANVLLVANVNLPASVQIAEHYARVRGVPANQVIRLELEEVADEIERAVFNAKIEAPIATWLRKNSAQDRILYIVLTKGIPLRVKGTGGRDGTVASVDSELTLLYERLAGYDPEIAGMLVNPYFLDRTPITQARLFSRREFDLYLVTRLDGYTAEDVIGLIDRGAAPARQGSILLDQTVALDDPGGNEWLKIAADRILKAGFPGAVVLDTSSEALGGRKDVLGYYSWGSNDPAITARRLGFGFVPGAVAGMYVSTDARTFTAPPDGWKPGTWQDKSAYYAGSPQSLAGDLVREGVTGMAAYVAEPYLDGTVRPDILFPAYVSGFNLAESFYLSMHYLSWRAVVIGDPLCAPFRTQTLQPADIDAGTDAATEHPRYFSQRRVQVLSARGARPEAVQSLMRAEARAARGDTAGAQAALSEAASIDMKLQAADLLLATEYERLQDYDRAIERYRAVLANENPNNIIALNNLAYALAVHKNLPLEAVSYAERALVLTGGKSSEVLDTLAWVYHLVGRNLDAAPHIERAVVMHPDRAEVRLHAAVIYAAVGRLEAAAAELAEAIRLDPKLRDAEEARILRAKLK